MMYKIREPRVSALSFRRHLAWTSVCTALNGEKFKNVDHIDCTSGIVSTRRWWLGVFALAQLGPPAISSDPGSDAMIQVAVDLHPE